MYLALERSSTQVTGEWLVATVLPWEEEGRKRGRNSMGKDKKRLRSRVGKNRKPDFVKFSGIAALPGLRFFAALLGRILGSCHRYLRVGPGEGGEERIEHEYVRWCSYLV